MTRAEQIKSAKCKGSEYFVHECFNGNIRCIESTYKLTREDYVNWEYYFPYDGIDEIERKKFEGGCLTEYVQEHHLYLDAGDCDDPCEVVTMVYD